jgi:hypothetical protein
MSWLALQIHQRMKGDAEWAAIEAKVSGKDTDYKVMHAKLHSEQCSGQWASGCQALDTHIRALQPRQCLCMIKVMLHMLPGLGSVLLHCHCG